ncbi:MAG TPA: CPBP family intramembrane glutamic endopeptidase [Candidatus Dormibacteraeota bacterium]|nr:CPBP family intramembrane glutamic endopeptidase [Candidatus Dormibacteraeota bacterium]
MGKRWANLAAEILSGIAGGLVALLGAADFFGAGILVPASTPGFQRALDATVMATGLAAAAIASRPVRRRIERWLPIEADNPVHALALALTVILLGTDVAVISLTDVLATAQSLPPLTLADLLYQEAPFLVFALVGVGLFIRRELPDTSRRLGFVVPVWWQVVLALAAAGVFFAFAQGIDSLGHAWTPGIARRIDEATNHVFGQLGGPVGIIALAIVPGLCEELLFRGALQPRIGLVATALLFTSIHTQYALSLDTAAVLAIALGLGLLRKYTNTTTSCTCHVTYNLLVGVGLGGSLLNGAVLVEAALVAVSAYAIWTNRRRAAITAQP